MSYKPGPVLHLMDLGPQPGDRNHHPPFTAAHEAMAQGGEVQHWHFCPQKPHYTLPPFTPKMSYLLLYKSLRVMMTSSWFSSLGRQRLNRSRDLT
jgi:hypothetical protein